MAESQPSYLVARAHGVLTLSFNRPEQGNAISPEATGSLTDLFASLATDRSIRAVLVRGEGKHFSAGGDIGRFAASLDQPVEERRRDFAERLDRARLMVEAYLAIEVPIIAACQGAVAGAGMLYALGADYVIADETVSFMFAHQRFGLPPDGGVSFLLPKVVGQRRAAELVLTAATVNADEAFRIGLVSRVVASQQLGERAAKQARQFADAPAEVVRSAKRLIAQSASCSVADQLDNERDAIVRAVGEHDFEEGVRSFLEKRPARFASTGQ